jgi:hypothetical protein
MQTKLFLDYKKERILYARISFLLKWTGNVSLLSFISIIIFMKDIHIKYSILTYYSILCRAGGMMCLKYFEVPTIVFEFAHGKPENFEVIHTHRNTILKDLFMSIYGLGFDRALLDISQSDLETHILALERRDWKKYGKLFALFFICMTLLVAWVLNL